MGLENALESQESGVSHSSLLQCPICQKPFTQETSYCRHVQYCRKAHSRRRVRNKACRACSASKVKCTFQRPCHRCSAKGIECRYDEPRHGVVNTSWIPGKATLTSRLPDASHSLTASTHTAALSTEETAINIVEDSQAYDMAGLADSSLLLYNDLFEESRAEISLFGTDLGDDDPFVDLHDEDVGIPVNEEFSSGISQPYFEGLQPNSSSVLPQLGIHSAGPWRKDDAGAFVIHRSLGMPASERSKSLAQLPTCDPVSRTSARLLMQAMRAYPYMMMRRETFPPFIHPHWHRESTPALPRALAGCMSIASMFAARTTETSGFLWEVVMRESSRCVEEMKTLSDQDLLASIQAHLIYIIMCFVDSAARSTDMSLQIILSHKVLCNYFMEKQLSFISPSLPLPLSSWEAWVENESRVRTVIVFFLISRIVAVYTASSCPATARIGELPLCSAKGAWEAKTTTSWMSEYTSVRHSAESDFLTIGDLIEAQGMDGSPAKAQSLDFWNARVDGLGTLLNIATLGLVKG